MSRIPKSVLAAKAFQPMYTLLTRVESGEVDCTDDGVVMDNKGWAEDFDRPIEASGTIMAWCEQWEKICELAKIPMVKDAALKKLAKALDDEVIEVTEADLKEVRVELGVMHRIWKELPLELIRKAVITEEVKRDYFTETGKVL